MTLAHQIVPRSGVWSAWSLEPGVLVGLAVAGAAYGRGVLRLGRRRSTFPRGRVVAFYGGLASLAVALLSPLDGLSSTLFSAHMVQHLLLVVVAAPLLAAGRPALVLLRALPPGWRRARRAPWMRPVRRVGEVLVHPVVVWCLGVVALWAWHLPSLYELALSSEVVHAAEHVSFLGSAVLFWAVVVRSGARGGVAPPVAVLLVLATALQGAALGAILSFAGRPLYPVHVAGAAVWGLSAVEDQALAGVLMWVPPGLLYLATMGALLVRWFRHLDAAPPEGVTVAVEHR